MNYYKGLGIIGLLPLVISTLIFTMTFKLGLSRRGDGPEVGFVLMLISVVIFAVGRRLNRKTFGFFDAPHSLFRIPLEWHALPLFIAGLFFFVATLSLPAR